MINKEDFLNKYNFEFDVLERNNISWEVLISIYKDFENSKEKLEEYANLIAGILRKQENVHTVRTRIKNSEHLLAKLIRKTPERREKYNNDKFEFTVQNYKNEITDIIGVRVIHIFKEDWLNIHNFILENWNVNESQANIREGDNQENFTELGIQINSRKTGYRSVHYLMEFMPTNKKIIAEIQVRTIFEEGYGEVDHQLSYPNTNVPEVLTLNLLMLNRLAGSADEMASAVKTIKDEWSKMQLSLIDKDKELENLKAKIKQLDIQQEQKDSLVEDIEKAKISRTSSYVSAIKDSLIEGYYVPSIIADSVTISGVNNSNIKSYYESNIDDAPLSRINSSITKGYYEPKTDDSPLSRIKASITKGFYEPKADSAPVNGNKFDKDNIRKDSSKQNLSTKNEEKE